jgi:hypothetical protein
MRALVLKWNEPRGIRGKKVTADTPEIGMNEGETSVSPNWLGRSPE